MKSLSRVRLLATSWTAAYQAPPPMGFSRQEYWSGVPLPSLKVGSLAHNSGDTVLHKCLVLSHVWLLVAPWTTAGQAPLSMGFPKQEYWSGLPFPLPKDLPDPGIKPTSPVLAGGFFTTEPPGKPCSSQVSTDNEAKWTWLVTLLLSQHLLYLDQSFLSMSELNESWEHSKE